MDLKDEVRPGVNISFFLSMEHTDCNVLRQSRI